MVHLIRRHRNVPHDKRLFWLNDTRVYLAGLVRREYIGRLYQLFSPLAHISGDIRIDVAQQAIMVHVGM